MPENRSTITHSVHGPGFKYDVLKGELSKGSHISKVTHPLAEVEEFKQRLLQRKVLKDMGTHWELRKPVRTGNLMAFNLHTGQFVKESLYHQDIVVTKADAARLKDKFPEKQVCVTDSEIVMNSIRDTQRFSSVNIVEVDESVLKNHGSDSFGKDEAFVLKILQEKGIVSETARHGDPKIDEADIVDESAGEQYEIVYEFKTDLPKKYMKPDLIYNPEILALQLVDSPFIHTSKALKKKLKKKYSNRYRPNLVILTLGSKQPTVSMLEALRNELEKDEFQDIRFANTYIISLDFFTEKALFARIASNGDPFHVEQFPCKNEELGFIKVTPIEFSAMENCKKYLMICRDIFENMSRWRYDEASELRKWAKEIRIWGIPRD